MKRKNQAMIMAISVLIQSCTCFYSNNTFAADKNFSYTYADSILKEVIADLLMAGNLSVGVSCYQFNSGNKKGEDNLQPNNNHTGKGMNEVKKFKFTDIRDVKERLSDQLGKIAKKDQTSRLGQIDMVINKIFLLTLPMIDWAINVLIAEEYYRGTLETNFQIKDDKIEKEALDGQSDAQIDALIADYDKLKKNSFGTEILQYYLGSVAGIYSLLTLVSFFTALAEPNGQDPWLEACRMKVTERKKQLYDKKEAAEKEKAKAKAEAEGKEYQPQTSNLLHPKFTSQYIKEIFISATLSIIVALGLIALMYFAENDKLPISEDMTKLLLLIKTIVITPMIVIFPMVFVWMESENFASFILKYLKLIDSRFKRTIYLSFMTSIFAVVFTLRLKQKEEIESGIESERTTIKRLLCAENRSQHPRYNEFCSQ